MSKGLEALERIKDYIIEENGGYNLFIAVDFIFLEKELKAMNIIRKKFVDTFFLRCCSNVEEYNGHCNNIVWFSLTKEEYELLMEVLYGKGY